MSLKRIENFNDVPVEIYEKDGRDWITAINIARALEYAEPGASASYVISRNETDFEEHTCTIKLIVQGQLREVRLLDRQGADIFAMLSKTPKATQFRRWIANVLQERRDFLQATEDGEITAAYLFEGINAQLTRAIEIFKSHDKRLQVLEESNRVHQIDSHQAYHIKSKVNNITEIIAELEGQEKPTRVHFIRIWTKFNDHFQIPSYKELPKIQYPEATALLSTWKERLTQELG